MRKLLRIQYMRPLVSIYSYRVPGFMETQVGFNPIQKRNLNPKRKIQTRLSVDRPVDRPGRPGLPESRVTSVGRPGSVDRSYPRAESLQSVDRGRSTAPSCARPCTPVDRPPPPVDRDIDRECKLACSARRFSLLCLPISVLSSSISSISSISSLPQFSTSVKIFQI